MSTLSTEELKALAIVQSEISVPKNQVNTFGKYNYRNAEDIFNAAKPLLFKHGLCMTVHDEISQVGHDVYVTAVVRINGKEVGRASAREAESKKGMDASQISGCASSYARKYAMNGVFLLDDVKDADSMDGKGESGARRARQTPRDKPVTTAEEATEKFKAAMEEHRTILGDSAFEKVCKSVTAADPLEVTDYDTRRQLYKATTTAIDELS